MTEERQWWQSKVLWVNAISLIVVAIGLVLDQAQVFDLTTREVALLSIAVAVLNALLRIFATPTPIAGTPQARAQRAKNAD